MRLWYQSTLRQTRWGARSRAMREILDGVKAADTEIELHGRLCKGAADDRLGPPEPEVVEEILGNVHRAAERGFDAFLIGNIADPGLNQTRSSADIPVLGLCEASLKAASMIGGRFSLVTLNQSFTAPVVDNIARYGMKDRVARIRDMGIEHLHDIDRGFDDIETRRRIVRRFFEAAQADGRGGADVIIAAGSAMTALLAYGEIEETDSGTPIVDGIANLVRLGELAVKVNRIIGGRFTPDRLDMAAEMLRSYDAAPVRAARPTPLVTLEPDAAAPDFAARRAAD
jgi:allantoin racemase